MASSDYLVNALPLTPETTGIFNTEAFAASKPGQVFINIGRGPSVDEDALIQALKAENSRLAGAALDVFAVEPLPATSELWTLPNVLLSPHNADQTVDFRHKSVKFFTDNCRKFLAGEELDAMIDIASGY